MNELEAITRRQSERVGHESLKGLIRKPLVQLLLLGTVAAQVLVVQVQGIRSEVGLFPIQQRAVRLAPVAAVASPEAVEAFIEHAVLVEAERLGGEYRTRGFGVSPKLALQIGKAAAEYEIDPEVAFGLVKAESSFRNVATSQVGAVGLTQLMPRTAADMEPGVSRAELRDPETNLRLGFKYLRFLLDKYDGNERLALLAYNRGPGTVDAAIERGRNPDNGYADFVYGKANHGHRLFTR